MQDSVQFSWDTCPACVAKPQACSNLPHSLTPSNSRRDRNRNRQLWPHTAINIQIITQQNLHEIWWGAALNLCENKAGAGLPCTSHSALDILFQLHSRALLDFPLPSIFTHSVVYTMLYVRVLSQCFPHRVCVTPACPNSQTQGQLSTEKIPKHQVNKQRFWAVL